MVPPPWYITKPYRTGGAGAVLTSTSATVTSAAQFGSIDVGDLLFFYYTASGLEWQGEWGIVQTDTSSSSLTMDRAMSYSGTVTWKWADASASEIFSLDTVNSVRVNTVSQQDIIAMPGQTSNKALMFDKGVIRTITVRGKFAGTATAVAQQVANVDSLVNAVQYASNPYMLCIPEYNFNSGHGTCWWVGLKSFDTERLKPDGTVTGYTLVAIERQ